MCSSTVVALSLLRLLSPNSSYWWVFFLGFCRDRVQRFCFCLFRRNLLHLLCGLLAGFADANRLLLVDRRASEKLFTYILICDADNDTISQQLVFKPTRRSRLG